MGLGAGIAIAGVWLGIGLASGGNIAQFQSLIPWGGLASILLWIAL